MTRMGFGKAGERQSIIMAVSLNTSAVSRYILHSGSSAVPSRWANSIVAILPIDSWRTVRSKAAVGEALASPTPTPVRLLAYGARGVESMFRMETTSSPAEAVLEVFFQRKSGVCSMRMHAQSISAETLHADLWFGVTVTS